ncbi:hypothetical protein TanjilG_24225 [Lupinus angustifolius]|uniref:IQ domain-containing protein IQM2-like n=1 Tax=Lupinus angustifolius TaxID=3871 RepID=A0A1J7GJ36_LUPAN|nr:PREDICTED: IQ domain-containing protein IQM2-like [Lupinus angustifolius]XP_019462616.1 PREDICTED: IQ domain-containing protein IQM2-like [Lupinus angustifolius]OIW00495.1 hypothetical protein TanjilG_24225 [Lupinus angustifolius]
MGLFFSCPFAKYSDVVDDLDSMVVKSINFGNDKIKTLVRSVSFKNQDLEPTILKSLGSGKMTIEKSVSFKRKDLENMILTKSLSLDEEQNIAISRIYKKSKEVDDQSFRPECQVESIQSALLNPSSPKHMAALKLQKVYKSFRTRRKLADCAILVEQSWWKLLDFAELKRSSISFFDIEKHETAISRWSRARTRAAKVGKGLSKDDKAQKLALQHWLEAIDPRHRYGHNLHFYYDNWLQCQSREPFFYWLDIGEGREVNLEKCPRAKLQQQCIKYLGPIERLPYEVVVEDGKFCYKQSGEILHTGEDEHAKWIFVLSTSKTLFVGKKKKGSFQHSSFLAGGATSSAGRLVVEHGVLKAVWPHSGHYRPTAENFKEFISFLQENNVNLSDVKMAPVDESDDLSSVRSSGHLRCLSSEEYYAENVSGLETEETSFKDSIVGKSDLIETESESVLMAPGTTQFRILARKLTNLEIPKRGQVFEGQFSESFQLESPKSGQETAQVFVQELDHTTPKQNFSDENDVETITEESILKRINSHKEMKSYQLGKQLSSKWTTGAGPRIGCVRDYPCELQFRALEQVNLSPRTSCRSKLLFASRTTTGLSPSVSTLATSVSSVASLCGDTTEPLLENNRSEQNSISEFSVSPLIRGTSVIPLIHML